MLLCLRMKFIWWNEKYIGWCFVVDVVGDSYGRWYVVLMVGGAGRWCVVNVVGGMWSVWPSLVAGGFASCLYMTGNGYTSHSMQDLSSYYYLLRPTLQMMYYRRSKICEMKLFTVLLWEQYFTKINSPEFHDLSKISAGPFKSYLVSNILHPKIAVPWPNACLLCLIFGSTQARCAVIRNVRIKHVYVWWINFLYL